MGFPGGPAVPPGAGYLPAQTGYGGAPWAGHPGMPAWPPSGGLGPCLGSSNAPWPSAPPPHGMPQAEQALRQPQLQPQPQAPRQQLAQHPQSSGAQQPQDQLKASGSEDDDDDDD